MLTEDKVDKFLKQGYIHLKNVIDPIKLAETRRLAISLKQEYKDKDGEGRDNGTGKFWLGLEMASTLDPRLWHYYTDPVMFELAKSLLQVNEPYLYNDQVVVKLPGDDLHFEPHYDNQYCKDPEAALRGEFKTINFCLYNIMPEETGPLSCFNNETQQYDLLPADAGDIIAIDGNTPQSEPNKSDNPRCLYACVYSSEKIVFQNFFTQKFRIKLDTRERVRIFTCC